MHELGVLIQAVKTVDQIAKKNKIKKVKHITLDSHYLQTQGHQ